jgi:E3 ubiquitin-protein ligase synoviolin
MDRLLLWVLVSLVIWSTWVTTSYFTCRTLFALSLHLIRNEVGAFLSFNLLSSLGFFLSRWICGCFTGPLHLADLQRVFESMQRACEELFFSLFLIDDAPRRELSLLSITLMLRYMATLLGNKSQSFSVSENPPTVEEHQRLFTGQLLLFFLALTSTIGFFRAYTGSSFIFLMALQGIYTLLHITRDICDHAIVVFDHGNGGNSQAAFRVRFVTDRVFVLFHFVTEVAFLAHQMFSNRLYCLVHLFASAQRIGEQLVTLWKWVKLRKAISERLPRADESQLGEDCMCIVCRGEMTAGNSRMLPCGHCMHDECLERWCGQRSNCPVCQCDLTVILHKRPPEGEEEEAVPEAEAVPQDEEPDSAAQLEARLRDRIGTIVRKLEEITRAAKDIAAEFNALDVGEDAGSPADCF